MKQKAKEIYKLQPKQIEFRDNPCIYRLFGGARSGGKSYGMRAEITRLANCADKLRILALRRTHPEIRENMITPFLGELPPSHYKFNVGSSILTFLGSQSTVRFSYCRNVIDVARFQGIEYDIISIEELTHWNEQEFRMLIGSLRTSRPDWTPCFFGSCNPGGVGHLWVKRLWVDRNFNDDEYPSEYAFIRATVYDNKHILDNDPGYVRKLESLPELTRKAWLEGDWDVFEGQYFTEWRQDIHVCTPFAIPPNARKSICVDYGYVAPSAVYWLAEWDDKVYIYREMYETGLTYEDLADKIIDMTPETEDISAIIVDPSLATKSPDTAVSCIEVMQRKGLTVIGGNNERLLGWNMLRKYIQPYIDLRTGKKTALLQVFSTCTNFIRTFPALIHDNIKTEDVNTQGEDHAGDAVRYGIMALAKKPDSLLDLHDVNIGNKKKRHPEDYKRSNNIANKVF